MFSVLRKILLATVAVAALGGTALAADLPSRRAPPVFVPPPIPVFTWTGVYAGAQVGYAFGRTTALETAGAAPAVAFNVGRPDAVIGGGHVGYNLSTQGLPVLGNLIPGFGGGGFVVGVEGDVDGLGDHSTRVIGALDESFRNSIQGSARARVGIAIDRALFYATGGAAFAAFTDDFTGPRGFDTFSHTRVGYTVGGGVEYAINPNLALRAEYRYSDFGTYSSVSGASFLPNTVTTQERVTQQRVQAGFSYKFDNVAGTPVVAKY